ncbi:MAG: polyhydroxyalkanoate depolymerase [Methylobacteriaceae bacterium]|nr:polyhydroxyalkanoate depolymerase [Methylobacteriaceae bacterium]
MDFAYYWYDAAQAMLAPARAASSMARIALNGANPLSYTAYGRTVAAACELFERTTRRYAKPSFGLASTILDGARVPIREEIVWSRPFCNVIAFRRGAKPARPQPKLLIVAPMSGHYATLLRGTVEAFLPTHEVMITDWADASLVPLAEGRFDLDSYIDYVKDMCRDLGPGLNLLAVCQPAVPAIAAVARLEAEHSPAVPRSLIMMGGPIDTRRSPTEVNKLAERRGVEWFRGNCIHTVPVGYPGVFRQVYPGFLQLSGFMAMNLDRHVTAHRDMFNHLVRGDGEQAEKHREFYDEYLAVMDLTAEFYLQTVQTVFVNHDLPRGEMMHRGEPVDLLAVRRCAMMAIEGENDDISGVGQTLAALDLTPNLPSEKKLYHLQGGVGHYGVFNGSRFRNEIAPAITAFIASQQAGAHARPPIAVQGAGPAPVQAGVPAAIQAAADAVTIERSHVPQVAELVSAAAVEAALGSGSRKPKRPNKGPKVPA